MALMGRESNSGLSLRQKFRSMAGKMDPVSIRLPYKNLRHTEVELVGSDEAHLRIDLNSGISNGSSNVSSSSSFPVPTNFSRCWKTLILSCMVAAGVQFGWALQLSLLTPYIQVLFVGPDLKIRITTTLVGLGISKSIITISHEGWTLSGAVSGGNKSFQIASGWAQAS